MGTNITSSASSGNQTIDLSIDNNDAQEPSQNSPASIDAPKVEDIIEAVKDPENLNIISQKIGDFATKLFTFNVLTEIAIIALSLFLGWLIRKAFRPKLEQIISNLTVPYAMKHILRNISKLTLHITALIIIIISSFVVLSFMDDWNVKLLTAVSKLLSAWIFIRLIAQIIFNGFLRNIIALFAWTIAALSIIGGLDVALSTLDSIGMTFGETRITLLAALKAGVMLTLLLAFAQFISKVSEQRLRASSNLTPSAQVLIGKIVKIALISFALIFGITLSGIDLSAFAIFGGALGVGIGFGLQKVISNLFSGILLLADRSIKPGDIIEMPDGVFGWIGQLNARYVSIVTRDNKEYLVPNEDFITQPVINWSFSDRLIRVETKFGVHYNSDPHEVKRMVEEVVKEVKRVKADPPPVCHLYEFGDSSLNFVLRYWIDDAEKGVMNTKGAVMLAVWDVFKENNIEIPYPHREVFMHESK